jgi:hypothetical protein
LTPSAGPIHKKSIAKKVSAYRNEIVVYTPFFFQKTAFLLQIWLAVGQQLRFLAKK